MLRVSTLLTVACIALVLGSSNADNLPSQLRIALAGSDSEGNSNKMSISWSTVKNTATSTVKYGVSSGEYTNTATGSAVSYYETYHHHVAVGELTPGKKYFYIVGDEEDGWSSERSFHAAPLSSELRGNFSFAVFGDHGSVNGDPTNEYMKSIKDGIDLVLLSGDAGYADDAFLQPGCVTKFCYEDAFDQYLENIEPWASQVPFMVAPGNHEADCHDPACLTDANKREKLSNFTAFNTRFHMPSSAEESNGVLNMHYSFNYGPVHFITIDAETGYPGAAEETHYVLPCGGFGDQLTWLENDLIQANKDRAQRPWILAHGHHPMYNGDSINKDFQAAMEQLFYDYGVDIYFAGHVHSYERDYPVYQGEPEIPEEGEETHYENPRATTHLLIGGAGNDEMRNAELSRKNDPSPREGPGLSSWWSSATEGPWTAALDLTHFGVGKVTIVDESNLQFEYVQTSTQTVFDTFTLTRDHAALARSALETAAASTTAAAASAMDSQSDVDSSSGSATSTA